MGIEKVIESYRKSLELVKDGIGEIDTESEHGKGFITEAQKVRGTALISSTPFLYPIVAPAGFSFRLWVTYPPEQNKRNTGQI